MTSPESGELPSIINNENITDETLNLVCSKVHALYQEIFNVFKETEEYKRYQKLDALIDYDKSQEYRYLPPDKITKEVEDYKKLAESEKEAEKAKDIAVARIASEVFAREKLDEDIIFYIVGGLYRVHIPPNFDEHDIRNEAHFLLDTALEIKRIEDNKKYLESLQIPEQLRDMEIPEGWEVVYTGVPLESLQSIAQNGLRTNYNGMGEWHPSMESLFSKECSNAGLDRFQRSGVIFAEPGVEGEFTRRFLESRMRHVLAVAVNPEDVLVADSYDYSNANYYDSNYHAKKYWDNAVTLRYYLDNLRYSREYVGPEVLIPFDINPRFIKLITE